jgi:predicted flavoprotein YhiN
MNKQYDVVIIGAGAAGMMCAIEAGKRGRKVLLVDHARKIGEKIRISGGGRCNFTNINTNPSKFISSNPSYMISALSKYTYKDFTKLIDS